MVASIAHRFLLTTCGAVAIAGATAYGQSYTWSTNPNNGREYALTEPMTWPEAERTAQTHGGHLATIRSLAEQTWIETRFGSSENLWIGLNDIQQEGDFAWSSGESAPWRSWCRGEPNGGIVGRPDEDGVHIAVFPGQCIGPWNDAPLTRRYRGLMERIPSPPTLRILARNAGSILSRNHDTIWFTKSGNIWVTSAPDWLSLDTGVAVTRDIGDSDPLPVYNFPHVYLIEATGRVTTLNAPTDFDGIRTGRTHPSVWKVLRGGVGSSEIVLETWDYNSGAGWTRTEDSAGSPFQYEAIIDDVYYGSSRFVVMWTDLMNDITNSSDLWDSSCAGGTRTGAAAYSLYWDSGFLTSAESGGACNTASWTAFPDEGDCGEVGLPYESDVYGQQNGFSWLQSPESWCPGFFAPLGPGLWQVEYMPSVGNILIPVRRMMWCASPLTFVADTVAPSGQRRMMVSPSGHSGDWIAPASLATYTDPTHVADLGGRSLLAVRAPDGSIDLVCFDLTTHGLDVLATGLLSSPSDAVSLGEVHALRLEDRAHGAEVWTTDGTAAGTRRLTDLAPGPAGSNPRGLAVVARHLVFLADAGGASSLYAVPLADYATYGLSCPGSISVPTLSARSPHIGRNWEITVRGLRPHSIGLLFFALRDDTFGSSSLPMDLGFLGAPACFLNVNTDPTSGAASHAVPADASGSAIARVPIPSIPSLLGATVFNQYISMDAPVTRRLQITTTNAGRGVIGP